MIVELTVDIDAKPADVWAVTLDVERWPEWTPSMLRVKRLDTGDFGLGCKAQVRQPRIPASTWRVTAFEAGKSFTWETSAFGGRMAASHLVRANASGGTTVTLTVRARGPLSWLLDPMMTRISRKLAGQEAAGLKRRCEEAARAAVAG